MIAARQTAGYYLWLVAVCAIVAISVWVNRSILRHAAEIDKLSATVDSLDTAVVLVNAKTGHIVRWSGGATRLFGWDEGETFGQPMDMLLPPSMRERHRDRLMNASGVGVKRIECWAQRKDGTIIRVTVSVRGADEGFNRFVLATIDVSDLVEQLPSLGLEVLTPDERARAYQ